MTATTKQSRSKRPSLERRLVQATQSGLALHPRPYRHLAATLGVDAAAVEAVLQRMLADGRIRRIAAVPNHYRLGYCANAMSVWDVDDTRIAELGPRVARLDAVSHCYRRPRHPPEWPYNLFAMVHARSRADALAQVAEIETLLGDACRAHDVLFSTRILKKTGLRFAEHAR